MNFANKRASNKMERDQTEPSEATRGNDISPTNTSDSEKTAAVNTPEIGHHNDTIDQEDLVQLAIFKDGHEIRKRRLLPSEKAEQQSSDIERQKSSNTSTRTIFANFHVQDPLPAELRNQQNQWDREREEARGTVLRLQQSPKDAYLTNLWKTSLLKLHWEPSEIATRRACAFYFPLYGNIQAQICDFRENDAKHYTKTLGEIEDYLDSKPDDVVVRWIHVPIGEGLLQSTVEEMFIHSGNGKVGKPFQNAGSSGWPYPNMKLLSLYSRDYILEQTDAFDLLKSMELLKNGPGATADTLTGLSPRQKFDLRWRHSIVGRKLSFWSMIESNFPYVLRQFVGLHDRGRLVKKQLLNHKSSQTIASHEVYKDSVLMICQLYAFHRSDGQLITFSETPGVDYIGGDLGQCLNLSKEVLLHDASTSFLAHVAEAFRTTGVSRWGRKVVEWLMVYLLTEGATTPHSMRRGRTAISLLNAYGEIVMNLKEQRNAEWRRGESVKLVRKFLNALEELRAIQVVTDDKIYLMNALLCDCKLMEQHWDAEGIEENTDDIAESTSDRINWALSELIKTRKDTKALICQFQEGLQELLQIRKIEQNDLAIIQDSQNRAILIFTIVTSIFLPLSFFTSYFGMNLEGLIEPYKNESFFWKTCGSATFVIVVALLIYAFREDILRYMEGRAEDEEGSALD